MRNLYMVLDCETATLPFIKRMGELTAKEKQTISIAKPLIYDIGWVICDRMGNIYKRVSYLVQETFFVPDIFSTAYYRDKREIYMEKFKSGEIIPKFWNEIAEELFEDCHKVKFVSAYNAQFDFKKAIPFTESYIHHLYSADYNNWEYGQRKHCESLISKSKRKKDEPSAWDSENFNFRGEDFPVVDIWYIACNQLVNEFAYKRACAEFPMISPSGLYFKTSAESVFRYLVDDYDFEESHTAIEDAEIETLILARAFKRGQQIEIGIRAFPFRELNTTTEFLIEAMVNRPNKITKMAVMNVLDSMESYLTGEQGEPIFSKFADHLQSEVYKLTRLANLTYGMEREVKFPLYEQMRAVQKLENKVSNAKDPEKRAELMDELESAKSVLNALMNAM